MSPKLKQILFAVGTFAVYTYLLNWKFATLLCLGIGWHEYCHILAAKHLGMKTKGFYLVPFMGGVAFVGDSYKSFFQRVFVVIMGPVGGSLPGFLCAVAYVATGNQHLWLASAAEWFMLVNLFNLLPLSFLDGGQITESITYSINETLGLVCLTVGTLLVAIILFKVNMFLFFIILFAGSGQVINAFKNYKNNRNGQTWKLTEGYMEPARMLTTKQIFISGAIYLGAALVLGGTFFWLHSIPGASINYFLNH